MNELSMRDKNLSAGITRTAGDIENRRRQCSLIENRFQFQVVAHFENTTGLSRSHYDGG